MIRQILVLIGLVAGVFLAAQTVNAAVLQNAYVQLSNPRDGATGVTHDFFFYHPSSTVGSAQFRYCVAPSGSCADSGADGASGSMNLINRPGPTNDTSNWAEVPGWEGGNDWWRLSRSAGAFGSSTGNWQFQFTGMDNPDQVTCNFTDNSSTGTCYVRVNTYAGTQWTSPADDTVVSLTVTDAVTISARIDPTFTLTIVGTAGTGQSVNGTTLTSGITTTVTTIPFGNLTSGVARYASHRLTVTGNNPGGYTVTADMDANLTGTAFGDDIDGFVGSGATTTSSQSWTSPTGTASGTNTGWLGVGTTDTGVVGRGDNQFFTLDNTGTIVARSTNPSSSRISDVVYGIEANSFQQADNYQGIMVYNVLATF